MKHKKNNNVDKISTIKNLNLENNLLEKESKLTKKMNQKTYLNKKQKKQRQENSLDELTRSFINYVKETKNVKININEIVKKLKVKKRRIYDITNVLEGKILNIIFIFSYFFQKVRYRIYKKRS
jgi:sulfite reductase alpha subunit-like flavoprotein